MSTPRQYPEWLCDTGLAVGFAVGLWTGEVHPNPKLSPIIDATLMFAFMLVAGWILRLLRTAAAPTGDKT